MRRRRKKVWPCLCGFDGTANQIQHHQRSCRVWAERDVDAVRIARIHSTHNVKKVCRHCGLSQRSRHHRRGCPRKRRHNPQDGPRLPPKVWDALLRVLARRYKESGRGAKLLALFPGVKESDA